MKAVHRTLAALAVAAPLTAAQTCSCSPTAYSFALNFAGNCDAAAVTGFDGAGVEGNICFFTAGGDPGDIDEDSIDFGGPIRRRRLRQSDKVGQRWSRRLSEVDFSSHVEHAKEQARRNVSRRAQGRQLDTTPVTVTSATFLEADTTAQLNIINQDSTYFEITASDGDVLDFTSISSKLDPSVPIDDQLDLVPGGVMMVLFGTNDAGEVVRNTVAWGYDNGYCGGEPLETGDAIGWVTLEGSTPPIAEFCEAVTAAPTAKPTSPPEKMEVEEWGGSVAPASKASKSQHIFSKSSKMAKGAGDAKAEKASAKSEKMSMEETSAKAAKMFKPKASKGDEESSSKAEKLPADAKAGKEGTETSGGKAEKMSMPAPDAKAGKEASEYAGSKAEKEASPKGSTETKSSKMSMPDEYGAPSAKAKKPSPTEVDAKAEKESSSEGGASKSAKGLSMPDAKSGKAGDASAKSGKSKSAKGAAGDAKAEKNSSSAKSLKPDPINWGSGYRVIGLPN